MITIFLYVEKTQYNFFQLPIWGGKVKIEEKGMKARLPKYLVM